MTGDWEGSVFGKSRSAGGKYDLKQGQMLEAMSNLADVVESR